MPSGGLPRCGRGDCPADLYPPSHCPSCAAAYEQWVAQGTPPLPSAAAPECACANAAWRREVEETWAAWKKAMAESDEAMLRALGFARRGRRHIPAYRRACRDEVDADNRAIASMERLEALMRGEGP